MHHTSRLSVDLLPPVLVPLLLVVAGLMIRYAEPLGASADMIVSVVAWFVLCAAMVALVLRGVAWAVRAFPSADDSDAYYRRRHF